MHPRLQRLGQQTVRFVRHNYHAARLVAREAPRVLSALDQDVLQPLSRAAKVASRVDPQILGGAKGVVDSWSKSMETYDTLRQSVLGAAATSDAVVGALPKKRPRVEMG